VLILLCSIFFSLITTFSKLAYEAGANPLTLVEARAAAFVIVVGAFQLIARRSFALPRRTLIATFPMAIGIMVMSIGYLSSVYFIKVSLAVVLAMLVAFGGLVMAIGLESESVDWRGVALVLAAALGIAGNLTFSGPYLDGVDSLTVNVWNNLWGAVALGAYLALSAGVAWPETGQGWAALSAVVGCYIVGLACMFGALKYLPPSQSAVMLNLEPVISIIVASLLLGEVTHLLQWIGVLIMLGALCFSALRGAKTEP
jgi:drug/metabolite transporter (DMT)-like permease